MRRDAEDTAGQAAQTSSHFELDSVLRDDDGDKIRGWFTAGYANVATRGRLSSHVAYRKKVMAHQLKQLGVLHGIESPNWEGTQNLIELNKGDGPVKALEPEVATVNELSAIVNELQDTATFCFQQAGYSPDVRELDRSFLNCGHSSRDGTSIRLNLDKAMDIVDRNAKGAFSSGRSYNFTPERIAMSQPAFMSSVTSDLLNEIRALKTKRAEQSDILSALRKVKLDPRSLWPPNSLLDPTTRVLRHSCSPYEDKIVSQFVADFRISRQLWKVNADIETRWKRTEAPVTITQPSAPGRAWATVAKMNTSSLSNPASNHIYSQDKPRTASPQENFPALPQRKAAASGESHARSRQSSLKTGRTGQRKAVSWSDVVDGKTTLPSGLPKQSTGTLRHPDAHHSSLDLVALRHTCQCLQASDNIQSETLGRLRAMLAGGTSSDHASYDAVLGTFTEHYRERETEKAKAKHNVRTALDTMGYIVDDDPLRLGDLIYRVWETSEQPEHDLESVTVEAIEQSGYRRRRGSPPAFNSSTRRMATGASPMSATESLPQSVAIRPPADFELRRSHPGNSVVNGYRDGQCAGSKRTSSSERSAEEGSANYLERKWPVAAGHASWNQVVGGKRRSKDFTLPQSQDRGTKQSGSSKALSQRRTVSDAAGNIRKAGQTDALSAVTAEYPDLLQPVGNWADDCADLKVYGGPETSSRHTGDW